MAELAADFAAKLPPQTDMATVVALSGELGAGKTTFAQAVTKTLGVKETVNSPTFVIQRMYALANQKWQRLVHIDAYRLKSADELRALGWEEIVADKDNLIVIEWPENVPGAIPESAHRITIEIGDPSTTLGTGGEARTIHHG